METFADGVAPGGLYDSREIKILICYMLLGVGQPFPRQAVLDILTEHQMANLFETSAAIDDLVARDNVREDEDGLLTLTEIGRQAAETLTQRIPYTLRERSLKAAMALLARARYERETKVDIVPLEPGFSVTCSIDQTEHPMMSFTLRVADKMQAEMVREHFLNDPTAFYRALISLSTGDCTRDDRSLTIPLS